MAGAVGRPTWAEIDLGAVSANYRALASLLGPGARLIPVVKADAYGHGAVAVSRALVDAGASMLAVALVEEGAALRAAGIDNDILVLEGTWPGQEPDAVRLQLTPAAGSVEGIRRLADAAAAEGADLAVHLKIDTGMTRLGAPHDALAPVLDALAAAPRVRLTGAFTHLACADEPENPFNTEQVRRFEDCVAAVRARGLDPGELHVANSAGLLHHAALRRFSARSGIALYGYSPAPDRARVPLRPVLQLRTRIGRVADIAPGTPVGYNCRFVAPRPMRAATLGIGYADGYRRALAVRARVIVRDAWAAVLGAVSMDLIVVDVTDIPGAREGDEAILLGSSASCRVDAADLAAAAGTIPYEVLCGIGPRVPRVYRETADAPRTLRD
jgi:alanine racemase